MSTSIRSKTEQIKSSILLTWSRDSYQQELLDSKPTCLGISAYIKILFYLHNNIYYIKVHRECHEILLNLCIYVSPVVRLYMLIIVKLSKLFQQ